MHSELIKKIGYRNLMAALKKNISILPQALGEDPFPLKHSFAEGLYIREILIPKGYFCIGAGHYESYFNVVEYGDMSVMTEDGVKRVQGPCSFISPAGAQRCGYSHEDTKWITVHRNPDELRDLELLDDRLHDKMRDVKAVSDDGVEAVPFDAKGFRDLTERIFRAEKAGFWSDWTPEQQEAFKNDDWELFSRLRNYSEKEIDEVRQWVTIRKEAEERGIDALVLVSDLVFACMVKNMLMDKNNEIYKSAMIPRLKG